MSLVIDGVPLSPLPSQETLAGGQKVTQASDEPESGGFELLLHGLGGAIDRGERIVSGTSHAFAGRSAAELIAIQAGIYRYSEAIELTAKLVDRATMAVRTVVQGGQ